MTQTEIDIQQEKLIPVTLSRRQLFVKKYAPSISAKPKIVEQILINKEMALVLDLHVVLFLQLGRYSRR